MRRLSLCLVMLLLGLLAVLPAQAQDMADPIVIADAWARPTLMASEGAAMTGAANMPTPIEAVSAAYMTIANQGERAVSLIAAATPAAGIVEIHETRMQGDVMQMRQVEGGIGIAPGESVALEPGGLHVMLLNLQRELIEGQAIALTLTFALLNDDGSPSGETLERIIGVPIVSEPLAVTSAIAVLSPWARPTMLAMEMGATPEAMATMPGAEGMHGGGDVSAVYLLLRNDGDAADRLVSAATDAAGVVEIHETRMQNDVMQMRPIAGLDLPPGETVTLEPGGLHIMLLNLAHPLVDGEALMLTLRFESGAEITLAVPIYDRLMLAM